MSWRKKTGGRKNLMEEVNGPWNQRPPMIFCGNPQHSETIRSCSSLQMSAREMPLGHCVCEEVILKFIWRAREPWISNMSLLFFLNCFMYECFACMSVCALCACVAHEGQKHHVGTGNRTWVLCKTRNKYSSLPSSVSALSPSTWFFCKGGKGGGGARREGERGGIKGEDRRQGRGSERTVSARLKLTYWVSDGDILVLMEAQPHCSVEQSPSKQTTNKQTLKNKTCGNDFWQWRKQIDALHFLKSFIKPQKYFNKKPQPKLHTLHKSYWEWITGWSVETKTKDKTEKEFSGL